LVAGAMYKLIFIQINLRKVKITLCTFFKNKLYTFKNIQPGNATSITALEGFYYLSPKPVCVCVTINVNNYVALVTFASQ
jgi:hypothetical protein